MILIKEKIEKKLIEFYDENPHVVNIGKTADEIIKLFVDAIKNLEFKVQ